MLVVSRRSGERVRLTLAGGEHIWIAVELRPNHRDQVRLGIDAPRCVLIEREELVPDHQRPEGGTGA